MFLEMIFFSPGWFEFKRQHKYIYSRRNSKDMFFKIIKEKNEEQKGGYVMTKKHFLTMSTIHKNDCVYDVKFAHTSKDMCNGKYVLMIGKITPKKSKTNNMYRK